VPGKPQAEFWRGKSWALGIVVVFALLATCAYRRQQG
jgi:hypothetical protein